MQKQQLDIYNLFLEYFSSEPMLVRSPGRVNLIGDHTDYNEGFVLPAAIDRAVILAIAPNNLGRIRAYAVEMPEPEFEADITGEIEPSDRRWPNYLLGVVYQLKKSGCKINGFDCVIGSTIPIGAGLSSSAALEGALISALNSLHDIGLDKLEIAKLGQLVEHSFVGVKCGIMDQYANLYGAKETLLKLDCRSLEHESIPFDNRNYRLLLCDTKVHRELAGSEYNRRREQCEEGVHYFSSNFEGVRSLRDVTAEMLNSHREFLRPVVYNRCRFVLEENRRVLDSCDDLKRNDFETFGRRMFESHSGLRDLYEVSCKELDFLVEKSAALEGVLGARMMGGGFGGCTINLVKKEQAGEVANLLSEAYKNETSIDPGVYIVTTANCTGMISKSH